GELGDGCSLRLGGSLQRSHYAGQRVPPGRRVPGAVLRDRLRTRWFHPGSGRLHHSERLCLPQRRSAVGEGPSQHLGNHNATHARPVQRLQLSEPWLLRYGEQDELDLWEGELRGERPPPPADRRRVQLLTF